MYRPLLKIVMLTVLGTIAGIAYAQDEAPEPPAVIDKLQDMTPEERHRVLSEMSEEERQALKERIRDARKKRREAFEALSPEEKEELKQKRRDRYEQMSEEEKAAVKERRKKMRDRRNPPGEKAPQS